MLVRGLQSCPQSEVLSAYQDSFLRCKVQQETPAAMVMHTTDRCMQTAAAECMLGATRASCTVGESPHPLPYDLKLIATGNQLGVLGVPQIITAHKVQVLVPAWIGALHG